MEEHEAWRERVAEAGRHPTPVIDRFYFRSIYFREPSGVLFEIATMGPGFATDEPIEHLGERLSLPPAFEHLREPARGRADAAARDPRPRLCTRYRARGSVRISPAISIAAAAASAPLLPCAPPARAWACSSVSAVTRPNADRHAASRGGVG